ncbi:MAG: bifunctional (p)ppGpp synthetase/guanosine-3',5'-bis(diphosphate) 3'-pyrophosphohydrolase, partial [Gemmatimonadetes bacterium]|nr:bifunctional (p)ppGpp synthetase/guanosine-3',5'-bis(diphosphate) 3'-pyrophosphohydrolase [Gemmatimonadota bacterium]
MPTPAPADLTEQARATAHAVLPPALMARLELYAERLDLGLITRAYEFSAFAHAGQKRHSGEDYVTHCVEVAEILAELHLDSVTLASGLIHDVVEDTSATLDDVRSAFGDEVAKVVDGLTKISRVQFRTNTEQQVENYRKLLLSMAQDARVILIKLADRLHNMRTLEHLREEKRRRIALETREIYAPLAHRLGMATIKWELEDLGFKFLEPEAYRELARKIAEKRVEREQLIEMLRQPLHKDLEAAGIDCDVTGRPKHLWSIHRKMEKRDKPYEEIYDLMAVRVLVETITDCYHALGII